MLTQLVDLNGVGYLFIINVVNELLWFLNTFELFSAWNYFINVD
jgi:hypothetical protein